MRRWRGRLLRFLKRQLSDGDLVAIGMGRNVGAVPDFIGTSACPEPRRSSAPSAGRRWWTAASTRTRSAGVSPKRFAGNAEVLYAPAYAETPVVRDAFINHDACAMSSSALAAANVALIGIGNARDDSAVVTMGCFSVDEMRRLRDRGAVGDILGSFFDADGHAVVDGIGDRVVAIDRADLELITCVVAICSERDKGDAILGALRSGMVNVLVTNLSTARTVLAAVRARMTPRVLCAGILVGDLFVPPLPRLPAAGELLVTDDFLMGAGGCAANVAVVLSKLGVELEGGGKGWPRRLRRLRHLLAGGVGRRRLVHRAVGDDGHRKDGDRPRIR